MSIDLNIEGQGEVLGWSPPITEQVLSPGFKATMEAFKYASDKAEDYTKLTRIFIDCLFQKGYCIARYDG